MTDVALAQVAVRLREAAPVAWNDFLVALNARAQRSAAELVHAPDNLVAIGQGRARMLAELSKELNEAPNVMKKVIEHERRSTPSR